MSTTIIEDQNVLPWALDAVLLYADDRGGLRLHNEVLFSKQTVDYTVSITT